MNFELIALDLDGTLTDPEKNIPETTRAALIDLMKRGKKVVLISGRPTHGVLHVAKDLQLDQYNGYVMGFNGGQVINYRTMEILYDYHLPNEVIRPAYLLAKEYPGACLVTYRGDTVYAGMEPNRYVRIEEFASKMKVKVTEDFPKEAPIPVNKLLFCADPVQVEDYLDRLDGICGRLLNLFPSDPFFGELMPKGIQKGNSLKRLTQDLGLSAENVIAFGDSHNDRSMIRFAGLGVAMENAVPILKEEADYITLSNKEEGVLYALKEFGLIS